MSLCFTVEKLNDVSEVHVVLQDDVPVDLHQRQGDEEDKVTRGDTLGGPDGFPDCEHVIVHQLWKKKQKQSTNKAVKVFEGADERRVKLSEGDKSGSRCLLGWERGDTEIPR